MLFLISNVDPTGVELKYHSLFVPYDCLHCVVYTVEAFSCDITVMYRLGDGVYI